MRVHRINKLLLLLAAVALVNSVIAWLYDRHVSAQLDHVHRHLIAGCTVIDGDDANTCEARWLTVLSK